tara:strand:- start:780 stop:959 length:180 start_codon:yes stop_codon:yes gene_type:complete
MRHLETYGKNWIEYHKELESLSTTSIVEKYKTDFEELFNRGVMPDRAIKIVRILMKYSR